MRDDAPKQIVAAGALVRNATGEGFAYRPYTIDPLLHTL
jgi:hypothetical protein